jgi:GYF domain 2
MWFYVLDGQQQGPFDEGQFERLIAEGTVTPGTYVWKEGQPNWLPLAQVRGAQATADTCQVCHQPVGADNLIELNGVRVCAACKPVALQSFREGVSLGDQVFAEGKKIVTRDGAHFPQRCVKCNTPTSGEEMTRKIYWHHPLLILLIFTPYLGIIAYIVTSIIVRKRATIYLHVCPMHRQRRIAAIIFTWLSFPIGFALIIASGAWSSTWIWIPGLLLIIAGIVIGIMFGRLTRTTKIEADKTVYLKGAGKPFMASLPAWPGK